MESASRGYFPVVPEDQYQLMRVQYNVVHVWEHQWQELSVGEKRMGKCIPVGVIQFEPLSKGGISISWEKAHSD